ncbi:MAG: hypothetical protein ACOX3K_02965 [Bacilli bacterium]
MKKRDNKKKLSDFIWLFIVATGAISFSYLYGSTHPRTATYAALMSIDAEVKKQQHTDFLHGSLRYDDSANTIDDYNAFFTLQRRTKTQYNYYNSFLVSSKDSAFINYDVDYGVENISLNKSKLIMVSTFYDFHYMESLGLPLFAVSDEPSKINSKISGCHQGAYISASCAEEIVTKNGMLEEVNGDLAQAFRNLLADETYHFSISSSLLSTENPPLFSLNNIYIDYDHQHMLNDFQVSVQTRRYGDYSKTFDYRFRNSIITFSPTIFGKGCSYIFDIRKNYGNIDSFFANVIGYDYAQNGATISLFKETGEVFVETELLNSASSRHNTRPATFYLVLAIALYFVSGFLFELFSFKWNFKEKLIFILLPLGIFILGQITFYLSLVFGLKKYILYQIFNSTGNLIFLLFFTLMIFNAILWSRYGKKTQK